MTNKIANQNQKFKYSLFSLYALLGVTSVRCPSPRPCARAHTSRLQRWRVIGNVWDIWSVRNLNPIPPAPEADVLPLNVPSGRYQQKWEISLVRKLLRLRRLKIFSKKKLVHFTLVIFDTLKSGGVSKTKTASSLQLKKVVVYL